MRTGAVSKVALGLTRLGTYQLAASGVRCLLSVCQRHVSVLHARCRARLSKTPLVQTNAGPQARRLCRSAACWPRGGTGPRERMTDQAYSSEPMVRSRRLVCRGVPGGVGDSISEQDWHDPSLSPDFEFSTDWSAGVNLCFVVLSVKDPAIDYHRQGQEQQQHTEGFTPAPCPHEATSN